MKLIERELQNILIKIADFKMDTILSNQTTRLYVTNYSLCLINY